MENSKAESGYEYIPLDDKEKQIARSLYKAGVPVPAIARELVVPVPYLRKLFAGKAPDDKKNTKDILIAFRDGKTDREASAFKMMEEYYG